MKRGLGLHIGRDCSIVVELCRQRRQLKINRYARVEHPQGCLAGHDDQTGRGMIAERLREVVRQNRWTGGRTVALLEGRFLFSKLILLPGIPRKEIRSAILYETGQLLGIDPQKIVLDYVPVVFSSYSEQKKAFFLMASQSETVDGLAQTCQRAGLKLHAIEVEPLAVLRLLGSQAWQGTVGLLTLLDGYCGFAVFHNGFPLYFKSVEYEKTMKMQSGKNSCSNSGDSILLSRLNAASQAIDLVLEDARRKAAGFYPLRIFACGLYCGAESTRKRLQEIVPVDIQSVDMGEHLVVDNNCSQEAAGLINSDLLLAAALASRGMAP